MKKFFYSLLFMAMAIVSAVSFVSCGGDDDKTESKPLTAGAVYDFSQDLLNIYNVKMTATDANGQTLGTYNFNTMSPTKTDAKGVKNFEIELPAKNLPITFTVEASCSKNVADLVDDQKYELVYGSNCGTYKEKGAGFSSLHVNIDTHMFAPSGKALKAVRDNGKTEYEHFAASLIPMITQSAK